MRENGLVPSLKAYIGIIESYRQAALYEESLITFNTMNEFGRYPTIERSFFIILINFVVKE